MLTDFFVNEYIGGDQGMGSPYVDGFFIGATCYATTICSSHQLVLREVGIGVSDDNWSSTGPSEENKSAVSQCGMSTAEVAAMTSAWADNMAAVQAAIIKAGGFNEQLMQGEYHVHQAVQVPPCATFLRNACKPNATVTNSAMMYGFTQVSENPHQPFLPNGSLPAFEQDLATFLLVATRLNTWV